MIPSSFVIKYIHPHATRVEDRSQAFSDRVCTSARRASDGSILIAVKFPLHPMSIDQGSISSTLDFIPARNPPWFPPVIPPRRKSPFPTITGSTPWVQSLPSSWNIPIPVCWFELIRKLDHPWLHRKPDHALPISKACYRPLVHASRRLFKNDIRTQLQRHVARSSHHAIWAQTRCSIDTFIFLSPVFLSDKKPASVLECWVL